MDSTKISKGISIGVRIVALLLLIFFFVPSICVSCQGVTADVSGFNAAIGNVNVADEDIDDIESAPWLFIIPILVIAMGILATKYHVVTMACAFANIVMMCIFKGAVKAWVKDYFDEYWSYVKVKTTAAFSFTIFLSVLVILAVAFDKFILNHPENKAKVEALIQKYIKKEAALTKVCSACGKKLPETAQFCSGCGAPIAESPVVETPAEAEALVASAEEEQ